MLKSLNSFRKAYSSAADAVCRSIVMDLPEKYLSEMRLMLKDEFNDYLESFNQSRLYGLRINTLKITPDEFLKISPFNLTPIPWIENGFYFDEADKPAKHPYYFAGLYYIQEPSAMTPANVLPVEEGDVILDMCAAPGGKSTELGARLNGAGMIIANDISSSRTKALLKNIELFGITNAVVLSEDPRRLVSYYPEYFDKIMIDAPCSGEGMFRKDSRLIKSWEKNGPGYYHELQKNVLISGADMLKPGGIMQYSTCTFSRLEDEESIKYLLNARSCMSLIDIKPYAGFSHGFEESPEDEALGLAKTVRIWPHKMKGEGHFVSLLRKDKSALKTAKQTGRRRQPELPAELLEFLDKIKYPIDIGSINIKSDRVFAVPAQAGDLSGLRVMRAGLLLGELKKNRFEPSQALAMALKREQYESSVNFSADDKNVIRYLKGETIQPDAYACQSVKADGWQLVCVDGYPLGWGKLSKGVLKNKYLAGWRMV